MFFGVACAIAKIGGQGKMLKLLKIDGAVTIYIG